MRSNTANLSRAAGLLLSSAAYVSAHGMVSGIVVAGEYYEGWGYDSPYMSPAPVLMAWSDAEITDGGFVDPTKYQTDDIICHHDAKSGATHASIAAGDKITFEWTVWPTSHHGPILDYLAPCNGPCESVDINDLKFFKIDETGLKTPNPYPTGNQPPGYWASDALIDNNNTWTVTIPPTLAAGNYVLRHEIIALHSADKPDGAQNYPFCFNLEVTGGGSEMPEGIPATEFYKADDPGIAASIWYEMSTYTIPGPTVWSGGVEAISTGGASWSAFAPTGTQSYASAQATSSVAKSMAPSSMAQVSVSPQQASSNNAAASTAQAATSAAPAQVTTAVAVASSSVDYVATTMITDVDIVTVTVWETVTA